MGDRRDEPAALLLLAAQGTQFALVGDLRGHQRERDGGMASQRRRQLRDASTGETGSAEGEAERGIADPVDRHERVVGVPERPASAPAGSAAGDDDGDRGRRGGGPCDTRPRRVGVQPGGQGERLVGRLHGARRHGDAAFLAVRQDGGALGPDGPRQQVEETGEAVFGGAFLGQHVEGAGEQERLLLRLAVGGAAQRRPALDERRRWRDPRGGGHGSGQTASPAGRDRP